jgi:branched-chain amino acid transport system permease protein
MKTVQSIDLRDGFKQGLIAGVVAFSVSAIGMVELFGSRYLITGFLTMGQVLVFLAPAAFAYLAATKLNDDERLRGLVKALIISFVSGLILVAMIWLATNFNVRAIFLNISPSLIRLLTFGLGPGTGSLVLLGSYLLVGLAGAGLRFMDEKYSNPLLTGLITTLLVGLLSQILSERIRAFFGTGVERILIRSGALQVLPAIILFVTSTVLAYWRNIRRASETKAAQPAAMSDRTKLIRTIAISGLLLFLPLALGTYLTEIANNVGLFLLMGLGLNIVVGLAGLLDLGYVAFFAIGAYTVAVLTSTGSLGIAQTPFWVALPIAVGVAALAGLLLGMPVLRMRGDYLAIVTMGFGEIIRILALSDLLKPYIGGAQGILQIPKPDFFGVDLIQPQKLYYVVLAGVVLAAFMSTRLRESRLGRRWMAMREDEDVAEAMGINLVKTKLLAFGIGAAFSGLAGAIFATKLGSIFPHSFSLLISINVLSLIIVGGLGSIPGTIVGAIILVGLPEILREFAEFRLLMYGLLLIAMMLNRPEGFVPSESIKRELHAVDDDEPAAMQA